MSHHRARRATLLVAQAAVTIAHFPLHPANTYLLLGTLVHDGDAVALDVTAESVRQPTYLAIIHRQPASSRGANVDRRQLACVASELSLIGRNDRLIFALVATRLYLARL